jgi:peptidyl-prolyl cis-trans isomerase D
LYEVKNVYQKEPDINEKQTIIELTELISQKNKFDYNRELLNKINNKKFNEKDFLNMGQDKIKSIKLNSVKDNKKFNIESVEVLYSMPINSLTLINDEKNDIYLTRIVNFEKPIVNENDETFKAYINKHNTNNKNSILQSYDLYLNNKYKINLNQKAIERIKNSF